MLRRAGERGHRQISNYTSLIGFSFDIPNGNEGGAIVGEWVPGGYTKNGTTEAALVGSESIAHNKDINQLLNYFVGKWEKIK